MMNPKLGHRLENVFGVRRPGVGDIGSEHRDFQAVRANRSYQLRQVLPHPVRLHVAALANCKIDSIEADFGCAIGQRFALQESQVLGEDRHPELAGAWLLLGRPSRESAGAKSRAAREQGAAGEWIIGRLHRCLVLH